MMTRRTAKIRGTAHATSTPTTTATPATASSSPRPPDAMRAPFPLLAPAVVLGVLVNTVPTVPVEDGAAGAVVVCDVTRALVVASTRPDAVTLAVPEPLLAPADDAPDDAAPLDDAGFDAADADVVAEEGAAEVEVVCAMVVVVVAGAPGAEICMPFPIVFTFAHCDLAGAGCAAGVEGWPWWKVEVP